VVDAMRLDAAKSRANMGALEKRMHELRRKSGEIEAIVELIDGIAFRTNILALNASIESSKAGEAGRGFAVVAQEVRRLAKRSAENAHQISDIVGRAREDIERGAALADHTGADLKSTDDLVLKVHEAMRDVVQLTRQGQHRSQEILDEVRDLMTLTDANGELVHQIAGASQALSGQGRELSERVESFKLN
jgi:methyl-accepting chemotaxis protein